MQGFCCRALALQPCMKYSTQIFKSFCLILKLIVLIIDLDNNMTEKHFYQMPFDKINTLSQMIAILKETITSPGMKSSVQEGLIKEYFNN